MRVVFISPHSDPEALLGEPDAGGQCLYEHQLALALASTGVTVHTFCRQTGHRPAISTITSRYTIHRLNTGNSAFVPKEVIEAELPTFTREAMTTLNRLPPVNPTIIHGHYWDGAKASLMLKYNYLDWPFVWTPHSLGTIKRQSFTGATQEKVYHFLPRIMWENYAAYLADRVIISSQDEKLKLLQQYTIIRDVATVIAPGIDTSFLPSRSPSALRKQYHLPPHSFIFLCLGRFSRSKGYQHALHFLAALKKATKLPFLLLIVGGNHQLRYGEAARYLAELQTLSHDLALENHVKFLPSVPHEQVGDLYTLANLFLMTSEDEPYGLTTVEAMACGTPVAVHFQGGVSSLITHGDNGFVVDMHAYSQTAQFMVSLLESPSRLKAVALKGLNLVKDHFSWTGKAVAFRQVYAEVAQSRYHQLASFTQDSYFLRHNLEV